jgi:hypothetical protein
VHTDCYRHLPTDTFLQNTRNAPGWSWGVAGPSVREKGMRQGESVRECEWSMRA